MKLYSYRMPVYRSTTLTGHFLLTDEEVNALRSIDGRVIRYGEIAGKHSDVSEDFCFRELKLVTEDQNDIVFFKKIFGLATGFNFKRYWFDDDRASEDGWGCAKYKDAETAKEGLQQHPEYDNDIMREAFINGFNDGLKERNDDKSM